MRASRPSFISLHAIGVSALVGATLGLGLALVDRLAVSWLGQAALDGSLPPTLPQTALAATAMALGYGALATAVAAIGAWLGRRRAAAERALVFALTALTTLHALALLVRVESGSTLTMSALAFFTDGGAHLTYTIAASYPLAVMALGLVAAGAFFGLNAAVRSASRLVELPGFAARAIGLATALTSLSVALYVITEPAPSPAREIVTPELSFLMTMVSSAPNDEQTIDEDTRAKPPATVVMPGPSRSIEAVWRERARRPTSATPNILLVTMESIATSHLGYMGYERAVTPNLDRIAERSRRMLRAWTTATHSNYAQMAILSSLFPRRVDGFDQYKRLDYPRTLLHDVFALAGRQTATISSQDERWQGMRRFETTETPTFFWNATDYEGPRLDIGSEKVTPDEVTVGEAMAWIDAQGGAPWSLYVNLQATHFPYRIPEDAPRPFEPNRPHRGFNYLSYPEADHPIAVNRYDNALHYVDAQIGRLERHLAGLGQLDNTIWVITADHGEMFHEHGQVTHGKTLYDGEARIPLLIHYPSRVDADDVDEPVSHLDIMPTILELAGLEPHPSFQGKSFADVSAHQRERIAIFLNIQGFRTAEAIVCWPYKLTRERASGATRLYKLDADPRELRDLAASDQPIARALTQTLTAQMRAQEDYHAIEAAETRALYFAPRLLSCPTVTNVTPQAAGALP